jgi:hypothetical protein
MIGDEPKELYNVDLSPNQMRSVSEAYDPHVERAGEPKKTQRQRTTPCGARSTDAGEWSDTTHHPGISNCKL